MSKLLLILRILLGLFLLVMGINKIPSIGGFLPMPPMPEATGAAVGALASTYVLPGLVSVTEIVTGAMLLIGIWVPLALIMLFPLSVNIVLVHLTTAPEGGLIAYVVAGLNVLFILIYRQAYYPMFNHHPVTFK